MKSLLITGLFALSLSPLTSCSDEEASPEENIAANSNPAAAVPATPPVAEPPVTSTPSQPEASVSGSVAFVTTEALNVRSGPGVSHPVISQLTYKNKVSVLESGQWTKIGENRYVYGQYLSPTEPSSPVANPIVIEKK